MTTDKLLLDRYKRWQGINCYNEQCGAHELFHCPMCAHKPDSCDGCQKLEVIIKRPKVEKHHICCIG